MKLRKLYILIFAIVFAVSSCYEDKGNYDYTPLNEPTVSEIGWSYYCKIDDTLEITPKIEFSLNDNDPNINYEWFFERESISSEKNLKIKISDLKPLPKYNCRLVISNRTNGCKFINKFNVYVISNYNVGWLLLTEKDGTSDISFVNIAKEEDENTEEEKIIYTPFKNVYSKQNGEKIQGNSIRMRQHWSDKYGQVGSILVVNSNGNIDLDGKSLVKNCCTSDYFFEGKVPDNFSPKDEYYLKCFSYIVNSNGDVYCRKFSDIELLQSGRYSTEPMYIEGGLKVSEIFFNVSSYCFHTIAYDEKNRRFIVFSNGHGYSNDKPGKIKIINTDIENFSNFNDLQKDLVYFGFCDNIGWGSSDYFALLKSEGTYYYYKFNYNDYSTRISYASEGIFQYGNLINENTKFSKLRQQDYLAFSSDDKLYLYNTHDNTNLVEFYDFKGVNITSICDGMYGQEIGVGLENGEFYILNVTTKSIAEVEEKVLYNFKAEAGKIKNIIYKYESKGALEWPAYY